MTVPEAISELGQGELRFIRGARCASGPETSEYASIEIEAGRVNRIQSSAQVLPATGAASAQIDLSGFMVLPGLINAHDHLEFALFPRLADPPYSNYVEWGEDIHKKFPEVIAKHHTVPKSVRLWWGGLRNLLCGVTTVCHHNPFWPELQRPDFPVRVMREYGWAHSVTLGQELHAARAATPKDRAFIVHACEGIDELARNELRELDKLGLLGSNTVLVHGLAIDREGAALLMDRGVSLVVCPSSNHFLFGELPDLVELARVQRVALGSDSPLTATGDLLDEVRFAINQCKVSAQDAYRMVTTAAAEILRLTHSEGSLSEAGVASLIAVRDTGVTPAERLSALSMEDVEFVMVDGRVQLASETTLERLPAALSTGLEPLSIGTVNRWVRAPIRKLLRGAEAVLGDDGVRLGGRVVRAPALVGAEHAR